MPAKVTDKRPLRGKSAAFREAFVRRSAVLGGDASGDWKQLDDRTCAPQNRKRPDLAPSLADLLVPDRWPPRHAKSGCRPCRSHGAYPCRETRDPQDAVAHPASPHITAFKRYAFSKKGDPVAPPWPDILIATGRPSILPSLHVKGQSGGRTFTVQLQDPGFAAMAVRPHRGSGA